MSSCLAAFVLAFVVACVATATVRRIALRLRVVDEPDHFRKIHQRAVPLLGGIAIHVAFAAPIVVLYFFYRNAVSQLLHEHPAQLLALAVGGTVVLAMGVFDDVRGLPARWKLLLQIVAATVAFSGGYSIRAITNPFGQPLVLGVLSYPATLLWLLCCMNAVNLLDGLDGLAAGVCLFASITLFLVSLFFGNVMSMLLMACLSGAILGFLLFNFHPASIFLGDGGSMLLGFLVGALSLLGTRKTEAAIALLIPVILLGLPILDTVLAVLRRWCRRLPIAAADRRHIHHALLAMGLSHRQAVLVLYVVCVVLCCAALLVTAGRNEVTIMVLGSLGIIAFVCVRVFGGVRGVDLWKRFTQEMERRQRCADARVAVEKAMQRMQDAENSSAVWEAFREALGRLDFDFATLRLNGNSGSQPTTLTWSSHDAHALSAEDLGTDGWFARLGVRSNGWTLGELELGRLGRETPLPEAPELLGKLRDQMSEKMATLLISENPNPGMLAGTSPPD